MLPRQLLCQAQEPPTQGSSTAKAGLWTHTSAAAALPPFELAGWGAAPLCKPPFPSPPSLPVTLVKFQRWMKCRATSRAAAPWTATPTSRHGIRGVWRLSRKSAAH